VIFVRQAFRPARWVSWLLVLCAGGCQTPSSPVARAPDRGPLQNISFEQQAPHDSVSQPEAWSRGLKWLRARQHDSGAWEGLYPVALTSLALLALPADSKNASSIQRALTWLYAQQAEDGSFRSFDYPEWPYEHALAVRALCRHLNAQTSDLRRLATEQAVDIILEGQQPSGGWHYHYTLGARRNTPLSATQMLALHAAGVAGIRPEEMQRALKHAAEDLRSVQSEQDGRFGYFFKNAGVAHLSGYALLALQHAGWGASETARRAWVDFHDTIVRWPSSPPWPFFAAWHAHEAASRQGGLVWHDWNPPLREELLSGQQEDGSWVGALREVELGPVYATALACLMLERTYTVEDSKTNTSAPGAWHAKTLHDNTAYILPTVLHGPEDAYLLDGDVFDTLRKADAVLFAFSPRHVAAHLEQRLSTMPAHTYPMPDDIKRALKQHALFKRVPGTVLHTIPPWAIAAHLASEWLESGDGLEAWETIPRALERRMRRGLRPVYALQPQDISDWLEDLPEAAQWDWVRFMLKAREIFPDIRNEWLHLWANGTPELLQASINQIWLRTGPETSKVDSSVAPLRASLTGNINAIMNTNEISVIVVPAWLLYGVTESLDD